MNRFCSSCGARIERGRFCPACGAPVGDGAGQPSAPMAGPARAAAPSGEIILGADGVYRWAYDMNLFKNPTILLLLWKIFGGVTVGIFLFDVLISMGRRRFWSEEFLGLAAGFGLVLLGLLALTLLGYLVYAIVMGGKYCVLFEMDEKGVTHTQAPRQFKKAQVFAAITAFSATGAAGRGSAILAGTKSASRSDWQVVKSISCHPRTNVIKVNALMNKNQVYASGTDFAFVRDYIVSHCPGAKVRG